MTSVAALTGALVLAAGLAAATGAIPDSDDGEVHFCFEKKRPDRGDVRAIDAEAGKTCPRGERELVMNREGPVGDPGPAGSPGGTGTTGRAGPLGPSGIGDAFFATAGTTALPTTGPVAEEPVPAGSYLISSVAEIVNDPAVETDIVNCSIASRAGSPGIDTTLAQSFFYTLRHAPQAEDTVKIALEATTSFSPTDIGTSIRLFCGTAPGDDAELRRASLSIVKVDSIG